jgi:AbiV family abortive infection protein
VGKLDGVHLGNLWAAAHSNALSYIADAETLATTKSWGHAYALATLAIEELAKAHIVVQYENNRGHHLVMAEAGTDNLDISEEKVMRMFRDHKDKRVTMLTQAIFMLMNTFDVDTRKEIYDVLLKDKPCARTVVEPIVKIFFGIYRTRETSMYVQVTGETPKSVSEEQYKELLGFAKRLYENRNSFVTFRDHKYSKIEKRVEDLLMSYSTP